jgi:ClpP class serine protease
VPNLATLTARYAGRPLLLEATAGRALLAHLADGDPRGLRRESRLDAVLRKVGIGRGRPAAMDQDDEADAREREPAGPVAFAPLWAQQAYGEPTDVGLGWTLYEGVAILKVDTVLAAHGEEFCGAWFHGYDTLLAALRECLADARVGGILILMDTPGGVVDDGLPELAAFMRENRAAAGGKPIHVHASTCCSAGYWIGAQGDWFTAGAQAYVGSIGVICTHVDAAEAIGKAGLKVTPIKFGQRKDLGADFKALSDEDLARLQADVDDIGADFIADVVAGRPSLTAEAILATQADVYKAQHRNPALSGLALGFVDAVCGEEDAFQALADLVAGGSANPEPNPDDAEAAGDPSTVAPRTPRAVSDPKERPMALRNLMTLGRRPAAAPAAKRGKPEASTASEKLDRIRTVLDGEGEDDAKLDLIDEITEEETDPPHPEDEAGGDPPPAAPPADPAPAANAAAAISASAEGKANPAMALDAIAAGLTLAQFKQMAKSAAAQPKASKLDRALAGSPRLGPDGKAGAQGRTAFGSALRERAEARRTG